MSHYNLISSGYLTVIVGYVPCWWGFSAESCLTLPTPWTVACQALLSMGFSRQEYQSGLPFPSPGDLPDPGIEPRSPALQADSLPTELRIVLLYIEVISIEHYVCFRSMTSLFNSLTCLDVALLWFVVKCHSAGFQLFQRELFHLQLQIWWPCGRRSIQDLSTLPCWTALSIFFSIFFFTVVKVT